MSSLTDDPKTSMASALSIFTLVTLVSVGGLLSLPMRSISGFETIYDLILMAYALTMFVAFNLDLLLLFKTLSVGMSSPQSLVTDCLGWAALVFTCVSVAVGAAVVFMSAE
ncbi:hypothetical protein QJS04_geneDACA013349 [Acorus gramineus]|uniref:NADH dehydrogenase subunit 5 n=1 Tax=Acorus gramineus TaxID=55184 RepID=A0AAV9A8C6_ACOGR|nr:hypothetical protein QJS04_geneDACA013349 [Acorus gramineus]